MKSDMTAKFLNNKKAKPLKDTKTYFNLKACCLIKF
jgi:hypothetical protein